MAPMTAFCGIDCSGCPAFIATQNDDDDARAKVAQEWTQGYGSEFKPEDINCDGCTATAGRHIAFCDQCDVRACCIERELVNCGWCADYPCDKLDKIFEMDPGVRKTLDGIKAGL